MLSKAFVIILVAVAGLSTVDASRPSTQKRLLPEEAVAAAVESDGSTEIEDKGDKLGSFFEQLSAVVTSDDSSELSVGTTGDDICSHDPSGDGKVYRAPAGTPAKSTYISWSPKLEALMKARTGKTAIEVEIKPGVKRTVTGSASWPVTGKLLDVGGDKQKTFKEEGGGMATLGYKKGISTSDTLGLMTGGNLEIRTTNQADLTEKCKTEDPNCMGLFPLDPIDETVFTLLAAVDAWKVIPGSAGCKMMLLIVGSTDLHAGLVDTNGIQTYYTITNYANMMNAPPHAQGFENGVGGEGSYQQVTEKILAGLKGNVVVLGGSTEFYEPITGSIVEQCGDKCSNAFVGLKKSILDERPPNTKKRGKAEPYPHVKAGYDLAGAKVYLAARN